MMSKVLVVYSGGLDSTVLLKKILDEHDEVVAINFNYKSKHNASERKAAEKICKKLNVVLTEVDLPFINDLFKSDLLKSGGDIPEGHYEAENMKSTVVPFRNGIMLSIAVGYAESIDANTVCLANHLGDRAIYPDCSIEFIEAMADAAFLGTYKKIKLLAPFTKIRKEEVVKLGLEINAPMEMSWSCYKGGKVHCGVCATCEERKTSFYLNGIKDPTDYLDPERHFDS